MAQSDTPNVQNSLGPFLIGSWLSLVLWTAQVAYIYRYFRTYRQDHWFLRSAVVLVLLCGTAAVIVNCVGVYTAAISNFGNLHKVIIPSVHIATIPLFAGITAFVGQTYLIYRYCRVSQNWIVTILLEALSLTGLSTCLWSFTCLLKLARGDFHQPFLQLAPKLVYSIQAGCDVLIAAALIHFLWTLKKTDVASTQKLLLRLMIVAFESGAVTTFFALATLVVFLTNPHSQIVVPFSSATGFFSGYCLLFNLHLRQQGSAFTVDESKSVTTSFAMSRMRQSVVEARSQLGGVTVHQATIVHEEKDDLEDEMEEKQRQLQISFMPPLRDEDGQEC